MLKSLIISILFILVNSVNIFAQNVKKPDPVSPVIYNMQLADQLFDMANYHAAAHYYEEAIRLDSLKTNYYAVYQAAECYRFKRLYHSSEKWYSVVADTNWHHYNLYDLNDSLSQYYAAYSDIYSQKGLENANKAIDHPSRFVYFDSLARNFDILSIAYLEKSKHHKAIAVLHDSLYMEEFPMVLYWYGMMQKANGKYYYAKESFTKFLKVYKGNDVNMKARVRQEIHGMAFAEAWMEFDYPYTIENLGTSVNDTFSDFGAVRINDTTLYFSGTEFITDKKKIKIGRAEARKQNISYAPYLNRLYVSYLNDSGTWNKRQVLEVPLNGSLYHIGNPHLNENKNKLYYTVCQRLKLASEFAEQCQIYYSEKLPDGKWGESVKLSDSINLPNSSSKNPFIFRQTDGKEVMLFASNRSGTVGQYDIWYTFLNEEYNNKVNNLGNKVNTYYNEVTPFYDVESGFLYFSSDGHLGLGEFDIFKIKGDVLSGWKRAENMGFPINTGADDYYYYMNKGTDDIFLASNRIGGIVLTESTCCDDIYKIKGASLVWANIYGRGTVTEQKGYDKVPLIGAEVSLYYIDTATQTRILIGRDTIKEDGTLPEYFFELNADESYMIEASKTGYFNNDIRLNTFGVSNSDTIDFPEINLKRIKVGEKFVVDFIYYDYNSAKLRPASYISLDNLAYFLEDNPGIKIELSSHTDSRGSNEYNLELSKRRAQSVVDYLIISGINPAIMIAKGYGETQLVNHCKDGVECTEEEHQHNRRTEVKILAYDENKKGGKAKRKDEVLTPVENLEEKYIGKVVYKIQVGVYQTASTVRLNKIKDLGAIESEPVGNGLYRFLIGIFENQEDAEKFNDRVKTRIDATYVVPYYNGHRITPQKAKELIRGY